MQKIYNTLRREKQDFIPIQSGKVNMYVCGMTVYDYCHLGHARVMVVFDLVNRWLRACGLEVRYVRNITDIDDKIIRRAQENGESISTLTQRYISAMHEDADRLYVMRPDIEPRATEYIQGMVDMIASLIAKGHAYHASNGDVFFEVASFADYGKLSGKSLEDLRAGERVEVDRAKRDPMDFVLWKSAKPGEPSWPSPWGDGRPGWHIECSVMGAHHLGQHFDIHGGGQDLQFPHHENEIAQSEAAHACKFVNYWMHNGFIRVDDEKMSKSLGNFFTIREVLVQYDAEVVRFFILRAHYRSPLNYADQHLHDAKQALVRMYTALRGLNTENTLAIDWAGDASQLALMHPALPRLQAALYDDFNTPEAIAVLFELVNEINRAREQDIAIATSLATLLRSVASIFGLLQQDPETFLQGGLSDGSLSVQEIESRIQARQDAKKAKNYAQADAIRQELQAQGILLEDSPQGTSWRRG